ncbi:hypothetical protein M408DRAFT_208390 [Serendipita vermifera MAFF 305830]|nr:hypothetical protein M408DRAFT_208390 [Serendipita vermifera MAFF 305830]
MPTIIFPNLEMNEIFENMCRGIMKRGLVYGPQMDVLTYAGPAVVPANRRAAGCGTTLRCGRGSDPDGVYGNVTRQCDEYPFASTREGGTDAHIGCVPWWQNSWQGIYYGSWISLVRLQVGKKFRVILAGIDCSTVPQSELEPPDLYKRQSTGETVISGSSLNGTWIDPTKFGNLTSNEGRGAFMVPLPELKAGLYSIPFTLGPGNISAMAVYDADGQELARKNNTGLQDSLSFTLQDDDMDAVLVAWASTREVQVDYSARRTPLPSTSSSSQLPQGTSAGTSGASETITKQGTLWTLGVLTVALTMASLMGL